MALAPLTRMISSCIAALNGLIYLTITASVLAVLHSALRPILILIAPRGWGAMRVAQERYVSVMSWIRGMLLSDLNRTKGSLHVRDAS
ncbi:hypothetical protein [Streptomyces coelicoflavus]|uniref:hypothetical protein n=1 Tax=Streptomyces coelicoflavus TaxID=285562 RepID=UPI0036C7AA32